MKAISIKPTIGVGDALQFSSVPENFYRATGEKLFDVNKHWFFDHNPYICRDPATPIELTKEMWNFSPKQYDWPKLRGDVYLSNAEIHAAVWGVRAVMTRPRLYRFEYFPFEKRTKILLHTDGKSHGLMPDQIVHHVIDKYGPSGRLFQIGKNPMVRIDIPHIETPTLWDLAQVISEASMLIGVDSGPAWIAACYPDVIVKKVRTKPTPEHFKDWVPLSCQNIHSHWDDRCHQIYNPTEEDLGMTWSYKRI